MNIPYLIYGDFKFTESLAIHKYYPDKCQIKKNKKTNKEQGTILIAVITVSQMKE